MHWIFPTDPQPPTDMKPSPALATDRPDALPAVDTSRKFVRVLEPRNDGLVAFEFAIGWPELAVELLLPAPAFAEFCTTHKVQRLGA